MQVFPSTCSSCGKKDDAVDVRLAARAGWTQVGVGKLNCPDCSKKPAADAGDVEPKGSLSLNPEMTEERRGQIALMFLKLKLRQDGIRIGPHSKRELGNVAKELGITTDEATRFAELLVRELVDETFPKQGSGFRGGVSNTDT